MKHRCASGDVMMTADGKYDAYNYQRMYCEPCYKYWTRSSECPCRDVKFNCRRVQSGLEPDREVCTNTDGEKCAYCYFYGYPCQHCFHNMMWDGEPTIMTYDEFRGSDTKTYQEFVQYEDGRE